jgi:hypothetical protein
VDMWMERWGLPLTPHGFEFEEGSILYFIFTNASRFVARGLEVLQVSVLCIS